MQASIADNLAAVKESIAEAAASAGRGADAVKLIAVSKTKSAEAVAEALAAGQQVFGENRVQEALAKIDQVPPRAEWHLIGHLQTNKARQIPGRFSAVHSLDSERLALALQKQMEQMEPAGQTSVGSQNLDVFIQLNLDGEATKSGVGNLEELGRLVETVIGCANLRLRGLMTLPNQEYSEAETRRHFAGVRQLLEKLRGEFGLGPQFNELSMGMSHDFTLAIAEGATMVRIGTAVFGSRGGTHGAELGREGQGARP